MCDVKQVSAEWAGEIKEVEYSVAYVGSCVDNDLTAFTVQSGRACKDASI